MQQADKFKTQAVDRNKVCKWFAMSFTFLIGVSSSQPAQAVDLKGIVDTSDHFIIPPHYEQIRYVGDGLFVCIPKARRLRRHQVPSAVRKSNSSIQVSTPKSRNEATELRNRNGALLAKLPSEYHVNYAIETPTLNLVRGPKFNPKQVFLRFQRGDGAGVIDGTGKMLLEPRYSAIELDDNFRLIAHSNNDGLEKPVTIRNTVFTKKSPGEGSSNLEEAATFSDKLKVYKEISSLPQDQISYSYIYGSDGHVQVKTSHVAQTWVYGYKNQANEVVLPAKYYEARPFENGLACVRTVNYNETAQYAFIDTRGNVVSPTYWRCLGFDNNDRAVVAINDNSAKPPNTSYIGRGYFGRWGLIDRNFKYAIAPKYGGIGSAGPGIYFASSIDERLSEVLNADGKTVFHLPTKYDSIRSLTEGSFLVTATHLLRPETLKPLIMNAQGTETGNLPDGTEIVKITSDRIIGIIHSKTASLNSSATVIFADFSGAIQKQIQCKPWRGGLNFEKPVASLNFDSERSGVIDSQGNCIINPEAASFEVAESDRFIKTVHQTKFDSKAAKTYEGSLEEQFPLLLKDYELIGMHSESLIDLIGEPDEIRPFAQNSDEKLMSYTLSGFGNFCANAYTYLELRLKDDRVIAWRRLSNQSSHSHWTERNTQEKSEL